MRIASLLLALALSAPAYAEFTAAEAAQVATLRDAQFGLLSVLEQNCGVAGNEANCRKLNLAARSLAESVGWLLGINVHVNTGYGWTFLAGPRSDVVAYAWSVLDIAKVNLAQATSFASNTSVVSATAAMQNVDKTLPYTDPYPIFEVSSLGTDPENQFGPHGHYSMAQVDLWGGYHYAGNLAIDYWLAAMQSGELPACPPLPPPQPQIDHKRQVVKSLAQFSRRSLELIHYSAHLYVPPWTSSYRTDAEEMLPEPAKGALTEIHLAYGPADNTGSNLAAADELLAAGEMSGGTCLQAASSVPSSTQPNVGLFFKMIGDGWRRFASWGGTFNVIR